MFICRDYKVIFVAIPKTGTRSIYTVLKEQFGGQLLSEHARDIPKQYDSYFSFCVVRNPYDRVCSDYWLRCHRSNDKYQFRNKFKQRNLDNTLENYISIFQNESFSSKFPQADFYEGNDINQVLRFENLQEDFNTLPFVKTYVDLPISNPTTAKTKANITIRPAWEEMITPEAGRIINNLYDKDFKLFNYEMLEF